MFKFIQKLIGRTSSGNATKPIVSRIIRRCSHCGTKDIKRGYYIRGWNNFCKQGSGDEGYWCNKCHKVTFVKTKEEYEATKQSWVTAWY